MAFVMAACGAQPAASEGAGASAPADESSAAAPSQGGGDAAGGVVRIGIGGSADSLNPGNGVLSEAYTLFADIGDADGVADNLSAFGQLAAGQGQAELALRLFAAGSALREELGSVEYHPELSEQAIAAARAELTAEAAEAAYARAREAVTSAE